MEKIKAAFQAFSRNIVDPVLYLAVTGIILAISTVCTLGSGVVADFGTLLSAATNSAVIGNLAVIFAVGLCAGFAKKQKANAAVLGLISYLMFLYVNNSYLTLTGQLAEQGVQGLYGTGQAMVLGLQVTDLNVFGGVFIGCLAGFVYNKLIDIKVPDYVRIYGGPRLALLAMIPIMLVISLGATIVWPPIAQLINDASALINASGGLGLFIYSFLNRFLIPVGMHHFMWVPFDYSGIGGTAVVAGETVAGATNIFYAEMPLLADGTLTVVDPSVRFSMFGFGKEFITLGIVLAMIHTARPENRKAVTAMLMPIYVTAALSGITEPLDFTILFAAPALWLAYSVLVGLSEVVLYLVGVRVMNMFGFIELFTVDLQLPWDVTNFPLWFVVGAVFVVLTYLVFRVLIVKFNFASPGHLPDWTAEVAGDDAGLPVGAGADASAAEHQTAQYIIEGLGGAENIVNLGCCMTRLRVDVKDESLVDDDTIKKGVNKAIIHNGKNIQVVVGTGVHEVYDMLTPILNIED